jgi:L-alanine-DL-glutamate epimerase-like enolase superfamily enzyme
MNTRPEDHVNQHSHPGELKITDIRTATVGWEGWRFPIIRIDTNQGLSGFGEVRDGASKNYALMLKSRLLGENPCNVDKVFRKIKQFGHHARQGGGVCGVEMALMDLAGKAYGVPAYVLAGGKFRDAIRMYCDTPNEPTGEAMGHKLKERLSSGFTMLKMDVGIQPLIGVKDALTYPAGMLKTEDGTELDRMLDINTIQHPFTHVRLTPKGIEMLCEYVEQVRAVVGYEVPIAADHFGHIGVDDCIRLGEALEPFNLAWLEDMVPWQFTDQWVKMERALKTPVCTGEDIYLKEGFLPLLQAHAVNVIHPDLATSGGILETKKIGDLAQEYGVSMALHMAGTPISTMAAVQCAAATENFIALEHHFTDEPFWGDFIDGMSKPIIQNGYITVPDAPGLGYPQ